MTHEDSGAPVPGSSPEGAASHRPVVAVEGPPEGVGDTFAGHPEPAREPRAVRVVLWLMVCLLPFHEVVGPAWRPLGLWDDTAALVGGLSLLLWSIRQRPRRWRPSRLSVLLGLFVAAHVVSAVANRLPLSVAFGGMRAHLVYLVMALPASYVPATRVRRYVAGMVAVGVAAAAYALVAFVAFRVLGGGRKAIPEAPTALLHFVLWPYRCGVYTEGWRLVGPFLNDNYFGMWLAALMALAVGLMAVARRPAVRWGLAAALLLFAPALAWTGSRGAFIGFAATVLVLAARVSRYALLLFLLVAMWLPFWLTPMDVWRYTDPVATEGGRVESIRRAGEVLCRQPLFGSGPGTRGLADMHYAKIACETGGLGLGAFLAILAYLFRPLLRRPRSADDRLRAAVIAAMAAMAGGAVAGEVWEIPELAHTFWILAGFSVALGRAAKGEDGAPA